jgi:uncharacterized protein
MQLFPQNQVVGVFRGYTEGGLEFHADLAIPYKPELHAIPMHGQFLLVQLETPEEAVLGRITALSSQGKLAQGAGKSSTYVPFETVVTSRMICASST